MAEAKKMTKSQIMTALAARCELPKKKVIAVVDALVRLAYSQVKAGFTVPGLGKLVLVNRKARMGRNPATGQPIQIPAKTVLKFRIAKAAKDVCCPKRP
ncbi:MAG TPA: HU family DNA-binding protein [Phycisphaerae bacterium]|nr:HU family DNA-binding protein [Phycisphaerae bacterium]